MSRVLFPALIDVATMDRLRDYAKRQKWAGGYTLDDVVDELLCLALDVQESRAQDRDTERRLMETAG